MEDQGWLWSRAGEALNEVRKRKSLEEGLKKAYEDEAIRVMVAPSPDTAVVVFVDPQDIAVEYFESPSTGLVVRGALRASFPSLPWQLVACPRVSSL